MIEYWSYLQHAHLCMYEYTLLSRTIKRKHLKLITLPVTELSRASRRHSKIEFITVVDEFKLRNSIFTLFSPTPKLSSSTALEPRRLNKITRTTFTNWKETLMLRNSSFSIVGFQFYVKGGINFSTSFHFQKTVIFLLGFSLCFTCIEFLIEK